MEWQRVSGSPTAQGKSSFWKEKLAELIQKKKSIAIGFTTMKLWKKRS
jgi:hypothetical protein